MRSFTKDIIPLVMAIAVSCSPVVTSVHVYVINNLADNTDLTVHCKSGYGSDLGAHILPFGGDFNWDFPITIGQTALYTCDMSWAKGHGQFVVFDEPKDAPRCADQKCYWRVDRDGLYLYIKDHDNYELQYRWQ